MVVDLAVVVVLVEVKDQGVESLGKPVGAKFACSGVTTGAVLGFVHILAYRRTSMHTVRHPH